MGKLATQLSRGLRLRCPACGQGKVFRGLFGMRSHCDHCGTKYGRSEGYFFGSIYVNYGLTALIVLVAYPVLLLTRALPPSTLLVAMVAFAVIFPLLFFRHARSFWMALDQLLDPRQDVRRDDGQAVDAKRT